MALRRQPYLGLQIHPIGHYIIQILSMSQTESVFAVQHVIACLVKLTAEITEP